MSFKILSSSIFLKNHFGNFNLSDENCKAVAGANGWNLTTALENCGTTLEFGNGEVVFTQVVKGWFSFL